MLQARGRASSHHPDFQTRPSAQEGQAGFILADGAPTLTLPGSAARDRTAPPLDLAPPATAWTGEQQAPRWGELALGAPMPARSQCLLSFNKVSAYKGTFPCAGCFHPLCQSNR